MEGIIAPLKSKGVDLEVTIEIRAQAQESFSRLKLDNIIKETLNQIGARIENWNEE